MRPMLRPYEISLKTRLRRKVVICLKVNLLTQYLQKKLKTITLSRT